MALPTTTERGIVLNHAGYSLAITLFGRYPGQFPRVDGRYKGIVRSKRGAAARTGALTRFAIWNFVGCLTLDQQEILIRMEAAYWGNPGPWIIYDYTNYWAENGTTNTRAIAPNSTVAADANTICYYPQWQAEPTNQRGFEYSEKSDGVRVAQFQFTESGVIAP